MRALCGPDRPQMGLDGDQGKCAITSLCGPPEESFWDEFDSGESWLGETPVASDSPPAELLGVVPESSVRTCALAVPA